MKKDIIVVCPDCNSPIYIYDKETVCFCKKCKNDYRISRNDNGFVLDKIEVVNKERPKSINNIKDHIAAISLLVIIFGSIALFIYYNVFIIKQMDNKLSSRHANDKDYDIIEEPDRTKEISFLVEIDKISEDDFKIIDEAAEARILFESSLNIDTGYNIVDKFKRYKVYLLNKQGNNLLILVYLCTYSNKVDTYSVYTPLVYENVKYNYETNEFLKYFPQPNDYAAPNVYFTNDHSEYTIGYLSFDELYNSIIKPLENEYKITEK